MKEYIEDQREVLDISEQYSASIKDESLIISPMTEERVHPIVSDNISKDQEDSLKVDIKLEDLQSEDKLHERNASLDLQQTDFYSLSHDGEKDVVTESESCHEVIFEKQEVVQFLEIQNVETAIKEYIEDQREVLDISEHYAADTNKEPQITSPLTEEKEHPVVSDIIKYDDLVDFPKVDINCEDLQSEDKHPEENGNTDLQQTDFYKPSHDLDSVDIEHITEKDVVTEFESCQGVFFEKQERVQSLEIQNVETAITEYIGDQKEVLDISEHYAAEEEEIVVKQFQEINLLKESPNQLFYSEKNISDKSKNDQIYVELNDVSDENMLDSPQIIDKYTEQEMKSFYINEEPKDIEISIGEQRVEGLKELQMESHTLEDQVPFAQEIQVLMYEKQNSECTESKFESQQSQQDFELKLEESESSVQDSEGGISHADQSKQEDSRHTDLKDEFPSLEEERGSVVSRVEEICEINSKGEYVSQLVDTFQENSQVSETFEELTYVEQKKNTMAYIELENDVLVEQKNSEQSTLNDKDIKEHLEDVDHYGTVPKIAMQDTFEEHDMHSEDTKNLKGIPEPQTDQETKSDEEIEQIESSVQQHTSEAIEDNKDDFTMIASQNFSGQALTIASEAFIDQSENIDLGNQTINLEPVSQESKLPEADQQTETSYEPPSDIDSKTTFQEKKEEKTFDEGGAEISEDTCDTVPSITEYVTSEKTKEITHLLENETTITEEGGFTATKQERESQAFTITPETCTNGNENTEFDDQLNSIEPDSQEPMLYEVIQQLETDHELPSFTQSKTTSQEVNEEDNLDKERSKIAENTCDKTCPTADYVTSEKTEEITQLLEKESSVTEELKASETGQEYESKELTITLEACLSGGENAETDDHLNNTEPDSQEQEPKVPDVDQDTLDGCPSDIKFRNAFQEQSDDQLNNIEPGSQESKLPEVDLATQTFQQEAFAGEEGSIDSRNLEVDQELHLDHEILSSTDNKIVFQQKNEELFEKGREEEMIEDNIFQLSSGEQESEDFLAQQQTQIIYSTEEMIEEFLFNDKGVIEQLNCVQPSCFNNVEDSELSSQKEQESLEFRATKQEDRNIEGKDDGSSEECACKVQIIQLDVEDDEQDHNSEQESLAESSSNNVAEDVNKKNIGKVSKTEEQSNYEENEDESKDYMEFKDDTLPEIDYGTLCKADDKISIQQESEQHFNINRPLMEQDTSEKNEDVKKIVQKDSIAESTVASGDIENPQNIDQINSFEPVSNDSRNHNVGHQPELYCERSSDIEPIFQQESAEVYHQKDAAEEISQDHYQIVSKAKQETSMVNKEPTEGYINFEPDQESELCTEHVLGAKPMCASQQECMEGSFLEGSDEEKVQETKKDIKDSWDSQADKEQAFVQESLSDTESYDIFQEETKEATEEEVRQKSDGVLPKTEEPDTFDKTEEESQSIKAESCMFTEYRTIVVNEEYQVPVTEIKYEGLISECDQTDDSAQPSDFELVSQDSTYSVILQETEIITGLHRNTEGKESFQLESEHETFSQSGDLIEIYQEKHEAIFRTEIPSTFDEIIENQKTGPDFEQDKFTTTRTQQENESLLSKIEEIVKGSEDTQFCNEESVDSKACLLMNPKVELTCSTVDVNKQEKEFDADHISYMETNFTSHLESKRSLLEQWHGEKETSEENVEVASITRTFGKVEEVVTLQEETEGKQVMEFSLNIIQTNIKFTRENDAELQSELQEKKMSESSTDIAEASGDEAVTEKQSENIGLQNDSIERDSINMEELFLKVKGITESKQTMEDENVINDPEYQGKKYTIELNQLQGIQTQSLESGSTEQAEKDSLSAGCENGFSEHNMEQKLLAESPADALHQEGTSGEQSDTEQVPAFSSLEDEYSKSDESLDSQDISIYSQKSEDFEISKDYQCEQTLPDSTPLPNLDDEFEEFGTDEEIASEKGQNVTEPIFEHKQGDMLDDNLESQSLQIVTEAILSSQIIAEAILSKSNEAEPEYGHNTKDDKQVSEDLAFVALDELRTDDQNQSDAEDSKLQYVSRESEEFLNLEENISSCLQASDELESSTDFQLPESLSTAPTLCELVEKSEMSSEKHIHLQSEQLQTEGIEELHFHHDTDESNFTAYLPEDQINLHSEQPKTVDIEVLKDDSCEESGFLTDEATNDKGYLSETKELLLTAEHSELTIPLPSDTIKEENGDVDTKHTLHDSMEKENVLSVNQFDKAAKEFVPEIPTEMITDSNETENVQIFTQGESIDGNEELINWSSVKPSNDFLCDYKGDEKLDMKNTEILEYAKENVEVAEKTLVESVILETDEFTSSAETSPNVTAISHGLEIEESRERITKESFPNVSVIESFEGFLKSDSEREVMKEPPEDEALSQDTAGDTSDSSFDSNSGNEREITDELHCTQTECHMQSETVNGLHEHTIVQATLDLEDLMFNGHSTDKHSKIVISERKTIVKVEEDIITTHTKNIIEEPILKFATSEGKNEGLFQSLLENSEIKEDSRLAESSEFHVTEVDSVAEESSYNKKILKSYVTDTDFSGQSEVKSSLVGEDLIADTKQSAETHQEIPGIAFEQD